MERFVGTSGFAYKTWRGAYYPEDLSEKNMLRYYGTRLPSVEINNTFYRLPNASVFEKWAGDVPEAFRFSIKAPRRITHLSRLKDVEDTTRTFFEQASTLGDKLGVVLFQLPPYFKKDTERLTHFLGQLPVETRCAFEFRHASWESADVYDLLRASGRALCLADTEESESEPPVLSTAGFGYLRLRRPDYAEADLARWAARIAEQGWDAVFVFFKHEDAGVGPKLAERLLGHLT